jgi:hypothetical protein
MLIARFLDGLAGSAFLSVAGGTVGDMFARHVSLVLLICSFHASFDVPGANGCSSVGTLGTHDGLYCKPLHWA